MSEKDIDTFLNISATKEKPVSADESLSGDQAVNAPLAAVNSKLKIFNSSNGSQIS